jgi:hypothetical protein
MNDDAGELRRNAGCPGQGAVLLMMVYCALNCDTAVEIDVEDLGCGAGRITCLECGGDGKSLWGEAMPGVEMCIDCKGSGYQLVSV